MSRAATGDTVVVRPANNIYTVLAAVAALAAVFGLIAVNARATEIFGKGILW